MKKAIVFQLFVLVVSLIAFAMVFPGCEKPLNDYAVYEFEYNHFGYSCEHHDTLSIRSMRATEDEADVLEHTGTYVYFKDESDPLSITKHWTHCLKMTCVK